MSDLRRFNSQWKENSDTGCWEWQGSLSRQGYGRFRLNGSRPGAHRASWILHFGEITDPDIHVLHICDNPSCVNPVHLFLGTNQDNVDDKMQKGRYVSGNGKKDYCPKCGSSYTTRSNGSRFCLPCNKVWRKENRKKNGDKIRKQERASYRKRKSNEGQ